MSELRTAAQNVVLAAKKMTPEIIELNRVLALEATPEPLDPDRMTLAWAVLCAETREGGPWEPDRYNAAAFVTELLATYRRVRVSASVDREEKP
jgi:hypothetical protein